MPKDEEIRQLLQDPGLSDWFKRSLLSSLDWRAQVIVADESTGRPVHTERTTQVGGGQIKFENFSEIFGSE